MIALIKRFIGWLRNFIRTTFHVTNPNLAYYITIAMALVFFGIALYGFVELTDELAENELGAFDTAVSDYVIGFRNPTLTTFFRVMTELGDTVAYIVICVLLALYFFLRHRNWKFIVQTTIVLLLATGTNMWLKIIFARARPTLEHLVSVSTLSYPSGHAMSAMAFYGFLIYLVSVSKMIHFHRMLLTALLCFMIFSIGLSRIYLGVHFPSDVLGGFIGGFLWVNLCIIIFIVLHLLRARKKVAKS
jgi:membrane-associated phospholipid phosphatase